MDCLSLGIRKLMEMNMKKLLKKLLKKLNHKNVSVLKSVLRILAGLALLPISVAVGLLIILAEVLGILEEFV